MRDIQAFVIARKFFQIRAGEIEKRMGRAEAIFLQVHERAGELNQAFIEMIGRLPARWQPHFFQHIVRFVIQTLVEAREVTQIVRVASLSPKALDDGGDLCGLFAHLNFTRAKVKPTTPPTATPPPSSDRMEGRSPSMCHEKGMMISGVSATIGSTMAVRSIPRAH